MTDTPRLEMRAAAAGSETTVCLSGSWTLKQLLGKHTRFERQLHAAQQQGVRQWDISGISVLDSMGALLLWRAWQAQLPADLVATAAQQRIFARLAAADLRREKTPRMFPVWQGFLLLGQALLNFFAHVVDFFVLSGQLVLDQWHVLRWPRDIPWLEISANLYKSGVRAMPVTALVGFLIGVVMSYLSALQLRQFGGEVFIVNILGMSIIRELGPVLVAVLVAGRSGSAMTAQLGVMRVTEEIDALATMGVSRSLRLITPKILALSIVMPLLVLWVSAVALLGGMLAAELQLDISYGFFIDTLPKVVPVVNVWIGIFKGWLFGITIALVACHFGLRVAPNTESLSANTTASVVTAITMVILVDAIMAIMTRDMGLF